MISYEFMLLVAMSCECMCACMCFCLGLFGFYIMCDFVQFGCDFAG